MLAFKIIDAGRVIYRKGDFELLVIFNSSGPVDLKIRSHVSVSSLCVVLFGLILTKIRVMFTSKQSLMVMCCM